MSKGKNVVAAGHELTAAAAAEILQDGGNAFDAALAGVFMTFVAEAVFSSPGGGGFLMARQAGSDTSRLFDFFTETPLKRRPASEVEFFPIYADFGPAKQEFHIGLGSSATPGVVPGLFAIHAALCKLPMRRLVEPAVRAGRSGFPLSAFQAYLFTVIAPILTASESVARIFAPNGKPMMAGETFRNAELAECLEWLAEDGARLFLDGDVGAAIVAESLASGGQLTRGDLARYRVELREPLYWRHQGASVALNPPPAASGALIAFGLAYLEALAEHGRTIDALALRAAMDATNAARATHGEGLAQRLAGGALQSEMREAARHPQAHRGTTHVSVIDADGNAASVSLSNGEGNGYIVGKFGFMLNNMLGEEDLAPDGARFLARRGAVVLDDGADHHLAAGRHGDRARHRRLQPHQDRHPPGRRESARPWHASRRCGRGAAPTCGAERHDQLRAGSARGRTGRVSRAGRARACLARTESLLGGVHAARRHPKGSVEGAGDPRRQGAALIV